MQIEFTKMHGLGNDFVVIDAINQSVSLSSEQIKAISNRHFGIGCDQLLLVEKSDVENADFRYRIYNGEGSEVEQCGNGARCFAVFVRDQGLTDKTEISVVTNTGNIVLKVESEDRVRVDMGAPILNPQDIPFVSDKQAATYTLSLNVDGDKIEITLSAVSMGNPHAVILVDDVNTAEVKRVGTAVQNHPCFPNSVNVGFMQIVDRSTVKLRVYERGVGETQACGTGACAAVVAGNNRGLLDATVETQLLGGNLSINWEGNQNPVMMSGPTATVFKGTILL